MASMWQSQDASDSPSQSQNSYNNNNGNNNNNSNAVNYTFHPGRQRSACQRAAPAWRPQPGPLALVPRALPLLSRGQVGGLATSRWGRPPPIPPPGEPHRAGGGGERGSGGSARSCEGLEDITRLSAGGRRAEFRRGSRRRRAGGGDGPTTKRALFCAPPGSWNQWIGGS
uniref:Uncharacterized protein n=1 Tax=Rangifer tarandus platyrhynchus TaxID=3082113 RepID=A0ACB0FIT8_RANTA|nr:unnamed protein product [Rangifer tarandus platyrhynchus]